MGQCQDVAQRATLGDSVSSMAQCGHESAESEVMAGAETAGRGAMLDFTTNQCATLSGNIANLRGGLDSAMSTFKTWTTLATHARVKARRRHVMMMSALPLSSGHALPLRCTASAYPGRQ